MPAIARGMQPWQQIGRIQPPKTLDVEHWRETERVLAGTETFAGSSKAEEFFAYTLLISFWLPLFGISPKFNGYKGLARIGLSLPDTFHNMSAFSTGNGGPWLRLSILS
jgi:hypothetical protein